MSKVHPFPPAPPPPPPGPPASPRSDWSQHPPPLQVKVELDLSAGLMWVLILALIIFFALALGTR